MGANLLPPTMIDIAETLQTEIDDIWFVGAGIGKAACFATFALFFGWLYSKANRLMGMVISMIFTAAILIAIPFVQTKPQFIMSQVALGIALPGVDVAGNAWLLELWQENANPYMNGLHFAFSLGLTFVPLISKPFLSPENKNQTTDEEGVMTEASVWEAEEFYSTTEHPFDPSNQTEPLTTKTRIIVPYSITAGLLVFSALLLVVTSRFVPYKPKRRAQRTTEDDEKYKGHSVSLTHHNSYLDTKWLIVLGNLLMCFYTGVEVNIINWLPGYTFYSSMKISKSTGAFMSSVMSFAFAIFRGLSIMTATRISSTRMLQVHFAIVVIGNGLFLLAGFMSSVSLTWVSVVIMGIGMSCMFPTIYSYVEERTELTNFLTGMFIFSSGICTVISPIIVGLNIISYPMIFTYVNISSIILCTIVFGGLFFIEERHKRLTSLNGMAVALI
jgi:fucose permease